MKSGGWNATTYDKISSIQEKWGYELMSKKKWREDEMVIDVGCGTGKLTRIISEMTPKGKVYAIDIDSNMIARAKINLSSCKNVIFINSDILDVELHNEVDAIFSNAVIHWILDHPRLFGKFWNLLKANGELLIQCGGEGNLRNIHKILDSLRSSKDFSQYFENWKEPWKFANSRDMEDLLINIGYDNIHTEITSRPINFPCISKFRTFVETVVMRPYLAHLPSKEKRDQFLNSFLKLMMARSKKNFTLDYVRLNIFAEKHANQK